MKLLTIDQVAEILGLSTKTVYRYVVAKTLPSVRLPSRDNGQQGIIRIRESDLDAFVDDHLSAEPAAAPPARRAASGKPGRAAPKDWWKKYPAPGGPR